MPNVEYFLTLTDDSLDTVVVEKQLNMINNWLLSILIYKTELDHNWI